MHIHRTKRIFAKQSRYVIHLTSQLLATVSFCAVDLLNAKKRLTWIKDRSQPFCTYIHLLI